MKLELTAEARRSIARIFLKGLIAAMTVIIVAILAPWWVVKVILATWGIATAVLLLILTLQK